MIGYFDKRSFKGCHAFNEGVDRTCLFLQCLATFVLWSHSIILKAIAVYACASVRMDMCVAFGRMSVCRLCVCMCFVDMKVG